MFLSGNRGQGNIAIFLFEEREREREREIVGENVQRAVAGIPALIPLLKISVLAE